MKKSFLFCCFAVLTGGIVCANVGVFEGSGQTPQLGATAEIQMVEEEVIMMPMRGNYPVDLSCRNMDPMRYHCTFRLRNLADHAVTVPVGFPLSLDAVHFRDPDSINQADLVGRFGFVAGTRDGVYPVRYVPYDKDEKFSNLFLWEMTFAPNQELILTVTYTLKGYLGLESTRKSDLPRQHHYRHSYLSVLEMALGQGHFYVTGTGSCWAGPIEKAVFRLYPFEFEEYLQTRGAWEETPQDQAERLARAHSAQADLRDLLTPESPTVLKWKPARSAWQEAPGKAKARDRYLELVYAPFEPDATDSISLEYLFPAIPTRAEQFDQLVSGVRKKLDQRMARRDAILAQREQMRQEHPEEYEKDQSLRQEPEPYSADVEKNLADVILEFYGIPTGNAEIQDFLAAQCWYPVETPPVPDPALKARLERASRGLPSGDGAARP